MAYLKATEVKQSQLEPLQLRGSSHNQGVSPKGWGDNRLSSPSGLLHGQNCLEHAQTFTFSPVELSLFESVRHELGLTITNSKTIKYYSGQQLSK